MSCNLLVMNARFSLGENWVSKTDYMFGFTVRHTPPKRICVWLHSATHPALRFCSSLRYWNCQCDTPRPSATPLREGMGCRIVLIINKSLPRHPLSERGGRRPGCVALSSRQSSRCVALSNHHSSRCVALSSRHSSRCVALSNHHSSRCVVLSSRQSSRCVALSNRQSPRCIALSNTISQEQYILFARTVGSVFGPVFIISSDFACFGHLFPPKAPLCALGWS